MTDPQHGRRAQRPSVRDGVPAEDAGASGRTIAWWHCFAGIAGDMALGSLVDAGADLALIERELAALSVGGWSIESEEVLRGGVAATHLRVRVRNDEVVRTHAHIVGLITEARLPPRARDRALATFARLAEVEGRLHRRPAAQVHFHEVGSADAVIDIVGTCVALEVLGIDEVWASPIAQGTGMVRSAHGLLPIPVPAVVELLAGAPTYGTDIPVELTTPTGAALASTLARGFGPMPAMTVRSSGYGAGTRDLDGRPNALQVVVGTAASTAAGAGHPVVLLEANVDDVTGEVLGHTLDALMAAGAHDAWLAPVLGKKGRPAHVVSALADPALAEALRQVLAEETGTLGVRRSDLVRWTAPRSFDQVEVNGHVVRVKRGPDRIKAEHDDVVRVARLVHLPVREVARRAEEEARSRGLPDAPAT
ncbi:nickel pincer cofactor biosynthesis protein LarC [Acidiferrimicrobium sp. IK]|uniref:nickel pincer cofactor biosynthesis protein LarC n=1 Tax=Acidiferrimicrobium sp. IK TaxID=2871700 RepID=UPI0021CB8DF9|nr:nickel pincer cofactor biosynthesis protein LarC [Acidiferrimicrobium sp. IK]MCU4185980.1 nickel pincer cofactor biosynthesis protein LarC [Acidiferrimicrobium sp. IK]